MLIPALLLILNLLGLLILVIFVLVSLIKSDRAGAPFIVNDKEVVQKSLELLELNEDSVFCDIGSGDGRVLVSAVKKHSVKKAIGYEISRVPYYISKLKLLRKANNIKGSITIILSDVTEEKLPKDITAIYLYLLPDLITKITPTLLALKEKNNNLKIVSPVFEIKELEPSKVEKKFHKGFNKDVNIYLY